jgi:mono/diheme cytochrome c family protein
MQTDLRRSLLLLLVAALLMPVQGRPASPADPAIERGRYLVRVAGCNDCHTPGYMAADGATPEALWLTGDRLGWRGPWGTTYASNLRLLIPALTEEQWLSYVANLRSRPPMPWFNLREMSGDDLRAIYRYLQALGPAGEPAPAYVPADRVPEPPFAQFP